MTPFNELTDAELVALTPEQVTRYVDFACAEAGVPLLPKQKPEEPPKIDLSADAVVFQVGNFHFLTQADALRVIEAIEKAGPVELDYQQINGRYSKSIGDRAYVPREATAERVYSRGAIAGRETQIAENTAIHEAYTEAKKAYDETVRRRGEIHRPITARIVAAKAAERKRSEYMEVFREYTELAEGNTHLAVRFLLRAKPDAATVLQGIDDPLARELLLKYEQEETVSV